MANTDTPSAPKESTPKRLSGATMNMKFMKRKQERQDQDHQRKRLSIEGTGTTAILAAATTPSSTSVSEQQPRTTPPPAVGRPDNTVTSQHHESMDIDDHHSTPTNQMNFEVATPIDMFGMQAALIGRRSFGGFNTAMEDAWKQSEASLKQQPNQAKKSKISDEELIKQYQDIVNKRSESTRAVGNLRAKSMPKRQRR